jgi:cell division protein FtsQ
MIGPITRHRWASLGAVLGLALAGGVWAAHAHAAAALREHPYFAIRHLVINGCGPGLAPDDVRAWLGLGDDTTLWQASPAPLRARLESHPYIAHASVRRQFPGRLEIVVREREPQAIAVLDGLYYVDRSGVTFGPLRPNDSRDYPFITGLDAAMADGPRTWALRRALRLLRRCDRDPCIGALSEVHLGDRRGVVVFPAAPRVPVVVGWGSWPAKLERAQRALDAWDGVAERLASLDVRFRNQVVVTLRQAPAPPPPSGPGPRPAQRPQSLVVSRRASVPAPVRPATDDRRPTTRFNA